METDAFGVSPKQVLSLTVAQCLVQGILISLLATFLSTRSTRPPSFNVYVITINLLCMGQTVVSVIQSMDLLDPAPYRESLVLAYTIYTVVIGAGVQAFFVDRCWKIFKKRLLPAIPLVLLSLVGLTTGVLVVVFKAQFTTINLAYQANSHDKVLQMVFDAALRRGRIALTVWAFSWFVLELGMTVITIVFLYRMRTGMFNRLHDGIFCTVWQVIWTSVTPPLILMAIVIIDGYVTPGSPSVPSIIAVALTAKFFALSLMITLVGQGHIREKFKRSDPTSLSLPSNGPNVIISESMFAPGVVSLGSPRTEGRDSVGDTDSTRLGSLDGHQEQEGDVEKRQMPATPLPSAEPSHSPQQISFST
ncbi:unnamed protein product [Rhizoctonia solani]|uniref:Uncharacterized protein n=1 Tax=Rhizoctonia solani TaxID=456999 RepID=A0A8H3HB96_9AGAM|nr:unnamed protein product [Rhizoctonia solani]